MVEKRGWFGYSIFMNRHLFFIILFSLLSGGAAAGCGGGSPSDRDGDDAADDPAPDQDLVLDPDGPDAPDTTDPTPDPDGLDAPDTPDPVDIPWDLDVEEEPDDPSLCTRVVEPGTSLQDVADEAVPGDVICIRAGEYGHFVIGVSGTEAEPIVFKAYPGERHQARITENDYSVSQGIRVHEADHIVIDGLWVDQVNQGIFVRYSDYVIVRNCLVTEIGQECLRFKFSNFGAFLYNEAHDCGMRASEGMNGEGIYVGSGDEPGDDTHGVLVRGNHVWNATDEGVELKGYTFDCVVEYNLIHDLVIKDGGAIKVSTPDYDDPELRNSGHVVRGNITYNIETRTVYSDGNGICLLRGSTAYNNLSYNNQHFGIRVDDKLHHGGNVILYHNTMFGNGSGPLGLFDDVTPDARNNLGPDSAGNMAATADMFVNASGGDFHLAPGAAAIDAGMDVGIAEDLEGTPRPQGGGFDMGAYEYR
jgi:hypothetical protein